MRLDLKQRRGFTLVELMAVVAIIGILAAMAVSGFSAVIAREKLRGSGEDVLGVLTRATAESRKRNDTLSLYFYADSVVVFRDSGCASGKELFSVVLDRATRIRAATGGAAAPAGTSAFRVGQAWAVPGCLFLPPRLGFTPFQNPGFVIVEHKQQNRYQMLIYRGVQENRILALYSGDGGVTWARY